MVIVELRLQERGGANKTIIKKEGGIECAEDNLSVINAGMNVWVRKKDRMP